MRRDPRRELGGRRLEQRRGLAELLLLGRDMRLGRSAGQRLEPAHPGRHRALADDLEQADIAGAPHVGPAAQLGRVALAVVGAAHRDDPDLVAILLAEQRQGAGLHRLVGRGVAGLDRGVAADSLIDVGLDGAQILRRQRRGWLKSKRSRSGATSEPFCVTCGPSRRRSASCSRWVAEWLARSCAMVHRSMVITTSSATVSGPW